MEREIEEAYKRLIGIEREGGNEGLLYHYRSLDNFWRIIESDSFWATNTRFSNDEEEQRLGLALINNAYLGLTDRTDTLDCYMVCFCKEDDKLSQWRGYANNGVSIGFDFTNLRPFFVQRRNSSKTDLEVYNGAVEVGYFKDKNDTDALIKWMGVPKNEYEGNREIWEERLLNRVPFIKHNGFKEEAEYRLVFEGKTLNNCICYRESGGVKIPYVIIRAGRKKKTKYPALRVMFDTEDDQGKEKLNIIKDVISKGHSIKVIECCGKTIQKKLKKWCDGCIRVKKINLENASIEWGNCPNIDGYHFVKKNEIIVTDCTEQEEVYNDLHEELHKKLGDNAPKIWCEGHLPIRSITIGPNPDIERVKESIEHYCKKSVYWLKDVDIKLSRIPYRS